MRNDEKSPPNSRLAEIERKMTENKMINMKSLNKNVIQMFHADKSGILRRIFGYASELTPHKLVISTTFGNYEYHSGYNISEYWIAPGFLGMVAVWDDASKTERLIPLQYYLSESGKGRIITREPVEQIPFDEYHLTVDKTREITEIHATINAELQNLFHLYMAKKQSLEHHNKIIPIENLSKSSIQPTKKAKKYHENQKLKHNPLHLTRRTHKNLDSI